MMFYMNKKKNWTNRGETCRYIGCNNPARVKGLCRDCYDKKRDL